MNTKLRTLPYMAYGEIPIQALEAVLKEANKGATADIKENENENRTVRSITFSHNIVKYGAGYAASVIITIVYE